MVVALGLAMAAGCSSESDVDAEQDLRSIVQESNESSFAFEDAIGECMRGQGFEYESRIDARRDFAEAGLSAISLHAVFLDNYAEWPTEGYGFLDLLLPSLYLSQAYDTVSVEEGFDEYDYALWGDPEDESDGGCSAQAALDNPELGEAEQQLISSYKSDEDLAAQLEGTELYVEWSECMRSEGFDFNSLAGPSDFIINSAIAIFDEDRSDLGKPPLALEFDEASGRFFDNNYAEELTELRQLELTVASSDHLCSEDLYPAAQGLLRGE